MLGGGGGGGGGGGLAFDLAEVPTIAGACDIGVAGADGAGVPGAATLGAGVAGAGRGWAGVAGAGQGAAAATDGTGAFNTDTTAVFDSQRMDEMFAAHC